MTFFRLLAVAVAVCACGYAASGASGEPLSLRVGDSSAIEFEGNPSTGYRWRLDEAGSENPAIVAVVDLGYGASSSTGKKLIGAPEIQRFRITGLKAGSARLRFEYLQPWVGTPAKVEDIRIRVE